MGLGWERTGRKEHAGSRAAYAVLEALLALGEELRAAAELRKISTINYQRPGQEKGVATDGCLHQGRVWEGLCSLAACVDLQGGMLEVERND